MSRNKKGNNNPYWSIEIDDKECVEFETVGKYKCKVIVDKADWEYLKEYSWTVSKSGNRLSVKTSINKQTVFIWRLIIQHRCDELDCWGTTVDHINNNHLDNRFSNLRVFSSAILNCTNISSKYDESDMRYIQKQGTGNNINGYKVHYNLAGRTFYTNFGVAEYGSIEKALEAAKKYRDEHVLSQREKVINEMIKKTRDIEFERGLRDKIRAGELDEVMAVLKKYGIE